jgi:hypothetical protein
VENTSPSKKNPSKENMDGNAMAPYIVAIATLCVMLLFLVAGFLRELFRR